MNRVCIIRKAKSKAAQQIVKYTSAQFYDKQPADLLVNYGMPTKKLESFFKKNLKASKIPILNRYIGRPKHMAIADAEDKGILCPETCLVIPKTSKLSLWIEKRIHSSQGKGIIPARRKERIKGKYYQKMLNNRLFELRVHCFSWVAKSQWSVQRRTGPKDQIAWNFHQGGRFQTVREPMKYKVYKEGLDIAEKILNIRLMAFGAVDLIVTDDYKIHFIEINSCPGFTELSAPIYFDAINKLINMPASKLKKI